MGILEKIFGNYSEKQIKRVIPLIDRAEALEPDMQRLSEGELIGMTAKFKQRFSSGETLDDLLPEAFAVVREATTRLTGKRHFRVQLLGGAILHQGRISEMLTGEGKTQTAALPLYLNALAGKGAHLVTVNEYLATRDAEEMGQIYGFLGLKTGCIKHGLTPPERRAAYECDITYATNNELGFDYLRDNMVVFEKDKVQRDLYFAIIDEVDSILIDEARTPLIISGPSGKSTMLYKVADQFAKNLKKGRIVNEEDALNPILRQELQEEGDYVIDEKRKAVTLTQEGIQKAERYFAVENLSDPDNMEIQHFINNALKANYNMHRDIAYVSKDDEIVIVDEFTGRLMPGRRFSDGLHQAIEAKENVKVQRESKTLATITFQNFFNKYTKKAGMTGTAMTEEGEFRDIYGMDVISIPTNMPMIRNDRPDVVYRTEAAKYRAIVREIEEAHAKNQPVLVGTVSIEKSELVSALLKKKGIKHEVLNAKHHEREAEIIAMSGQVGNITIATNMAGRGTDIKLGGNAEYLAKQKMRKQGFNDEDIYNAMSLSDTQDEKILANRQTYSAIIAECDEEIKPQKEAVREAGGLKIIGTERHEARRIDNQLRGRAGRQGDAGETRFFISMEDELMRLFGGDRMTKIADTLRMDEDDVIEHGMISRAIENAQKKVEGNNFGIRKHLLQYDQVMNEQREIIYSERNKIIAGEDLQDHIMNMLKAVLDRAADAYLTGDIPDEWDIPALNENLMLIYHKPALELTSVELDTTTKDSVKTKLYDEAVQLYKKREATITPERMRELERVFLMRTVDQKWMNHIDEMDQMRQGISLRSYAQRDPLVEYKFLGFEMFEEMSNNIQLDTVRALFNVAVVNEMQPQMQQAVKKEDMSTNQDATAVKRPTRRDSDKVGRNDPCPCGSGKKYKQCCVNKVS
ncbi:MAG: preprotein translocase subunit SecA [Defluviitaleaceae bacterium]|nr:preprotein translocase subunit SecA [Defluviitaleaceae bacterium]